MRKKSSVKTLFIDIGGVLLTNGWDSDSRKLAAKTFQLDFGEINDRHRLNFDIYEIGKLSLDEYLNRVIFYKKRTFTKNQFQKFMFAQSKSFPKMIGLIRKLKAIHGLKIVVISNEGRELTLHRIKTFKLNNFIDFFISSCFVHLRKPDEDIYRIALDIAQVSIKEVLYIEDRLLFVEVAENLGIQSLHHIDFQSTKVKLLSLLPIL
jgi:putative hydrolase of the HAD superfamily